MGKEALRPGRLGRTRGASQTWLRTEHQQGPVPGPRPLGSRGHVVFLKGDFSARLVWVGCFCQAKNVQNEANRHVPLCFFSQPLESCSPHAQKLSLEGRGVGRGEARLSSVVGEARHTHGSPLNPNAAEWVLGTKTTGDSAKRENMSTKSSFPF